MPRYDWMVGENNQILMLRETEAANKRSDIFSAPNFRSQTSRMRQKSLHYLRNANCVIGKPVISNHLRGLNPETEKAVGDEERAIVSINDVPLQQTVHRTLHVRG